MRRRPARPHGGAGPVMARPAAARPLAARLATWAVASIGLCAAAGAWGPPAGAEPGRTRAAAGSHRTAAAAGRSAFEARCSLHLSFRQLERASARPGDPCVQLLGQVFQYAPGRDRHTMLVDMTSTGGGIWNTTIEVRFPAARRGRPLTVDDVVEVWGTVAGSTTARTRFGGRIHVPVVDARYLVLRHAIASTITTPAAT